MRAGGGGRRAAPAGAGGPPPPPGAPPRGGGGGGPRAPGRVGYDSEAAFNRAFKREFGTPPAAWRRSARATRIRGNEDTGE